VTWWAYALWRGVSGRCRRLLRSTVGQTVSRRWLRQEAYRAGQRGIDGPTWTWPIPMRILRTGGVASRSSSRAGRSDEVGA
jgi:hypothetical protein